MLPTMFIGHGGGPLPLIGHPSHQELVQTWSADGQLREVLNDDAVRAVVVVSAHHESSDGAVEVMTDEQPGLLFDYGGFPPETYQYTMPNPGAPAVAKRVLDLLDQANIPARQQSGRGRDHGVFVPWLGLQMHVSRPELPVISVSLRGPGTNRPGITQDHIDLGKALEPLRREGILIIGSGNSIHGRCAQSQAAAFDDHLQRLAAEGPGAFARWADHPMARLCHPRPEHLIPLLVCAGASMEDSVESVQHLCMGFASSHFVFGR